MDAYDIGLAIAKFAGILAAAIFGVIGIKHDFKDSAGVITSWGHVAIWGVIGSALLSTGSHVLEVLKASDTARSSHQLLSQVSRSLELVDADNIRIDLGLSFSIEDPAFKDYRLRLEQTYKEMKEDLDRSKRKLLLKPEKKLRLLRIDFSKDGGDVYDVLTIYSGSAIWPDPNAPREESAESILSGLGARLEFQNPKYLGSRNNLDMTIAGRLDDRQIPGTRQFPYAEMNYDTKTRRLTIHIKGAATGIPISRSQAFLSIIDFDGSSVKIELNYNKDELKLVPSMSLLEFRLAFGSNRRSLIRAKEVQKSESDGLVIFSTKLVSRWFDSEKTPG